MTLDHLAAYLEAEGIGTIGTDIFKSRMPEHIDEGIALLDDAGGPPGFNHSEPGVIDWEEPVVEVLVRSLNYPTAMQRSEEIREILSRISNEEIDGIFFLRVSPQVSPFKAGHDANERELVSCTYTVMKRPG